MIVAHRTLKEVPSIKVSTQEQNQTEVGNLILCKLNDIIALEYL
jgi:hypothetical protein